MQVLQTASALTAFFLPAANGQRFCVYYAPPAGVTIRGAVLVVPPFAEEMNCCRRLIADQARMLAGAGFGTLTLDLFGCGDSSGDFGDAQWDIWQDDLQLARAWLRANVSDSFNLLGVRLGGLLALEFTGRTDALVERIVLWQPVTQGDVFLTQFLRLRLAGDMLGADSPATSTSELRRALNSGQTVEVAGYAVNPRLAEALDRMRAIDHGPHCNAAHWLEIAANASREPGPASARILQAWRASGRSIAARAVPGTPFWSLPDAADQPELLAATMEAFVP